MRFEGLKTRRIYGHFKFIRGFRAIYELDGVPSEVPVIAFASFVERYYDRSTGKQVEPPTGGIEAFTLASDSGGELRRAEDDFLLEIIEDGDGIPERFVELAQRNKARRDEEMEEARRAHLGARR